MENTQEAGFKEKFKGLKVHEEPVPGVALLSDVTHYVTFQILLLASLFSTELVASHFSVLKINTKTVKEYPWNNGLLRKNGLSINSSRRNHK